YIFCIILLPPHRSTLFPYTTLFRSDFDTSEKRLEAFRKAFESLDYKTEPAKVSPESFVSKTVSLASKHTYADRFSYALSTESTRSEEHTSELQSRENLVCRLLLEKK